MHERAAADLPLQGQPADLGRLDGDGTSFNRICRASGISASNYSLSARSDLGCLDGVGPF
eukprot:1160535-Pelagomonas_calceolata.AAC.2